jgi:Protein of unknown function (DUF3606)
MADNFKNGGAPDRSRVSMDDQHQVRYWMETIGCSKDELAAAVARVGNSSDAVRREVYRHWAYGTVRRDPATAKAPQRPGGRPSRRSVKAPVRSPGPPHHKGSETPPATVTLHRRRRGSRLRASRTLPVVREPRDSPVRHVSLTASETDVGGDSHEKDDERASLWRAREDAQDQRENRASRVAHGFGARTWHRAGAAIRKFTTWKAH